MGEGGGHAGPASLENAPKKKRKVEKEERGKREERERGVGNPAFLEAKYGPF